MSEERFTPEQSPKPPESDTLGESDNRSTEKLKAWLEEKRQHPLKTTGRLGAAFFALASFAANPAETLINIFSGAAQEGLQGGMRSAAAKIRGTDRKYNGEQ